MKCTFCGNPLNHTDKFCPECGTRVDWIEMNLDLPYDDPVPYPQNKPNREVNVLLIAVLAILLVTIISSAVILLGPVADKSASASDESDSATEATATAVINDEEEVEEELSSRFGLAEEFNLSSYRRVDAWAEADHYISGPQYKYDYRGYRAMDGDSISSWQTHNCPSVLSADLGGTHNIRAISFKLGNWRKEKYYYENRRPSRMTVKLGGEVFSLDFSDGKKEFVLEFSRAITADSARFIVEDYYNGTETDDIAVSEITLFEE